MSAIVDDIARFLFGVFWCGSRLCENAGASRGGRTNLYVTLILTRQAAVWAPMRRVFGVAHMARGKFLLSSPTISAFSHSLDRSRSSSVPTCLAGLNEA